MSKLAHSNQAVADDLIALLESATGSDRKLDAMIFDRLGLVNESHCKNWCQMEGRADLTRDMYIAAWAPDFTRALDATLTLIPDGLFWSIGHGRTRADEPLGGAKIVDPSSLETVAEAEAPTAVLALCIAAIKARAALAKATAA